MTDPGKTTLLLQARSRAEAQIVLALLRGENIAAYVGGEALTDEFAASQRLMGLQGTEIEVREADLEQARRVLDEAKRGGQMLGDEPAVPPSETNGGVASKVVAGVAVMLAVLFFFLWLDTKRDLDWIRATAAGRFTRIDVQPDGAWFVWKDTEKLASVVLDADHDGIPERTTSYNRAGVKYAEHVDADEDGWPERSEHFSPEGRLVAESVDSDGNGWAETSTTRYPDGFSCIWRDADHEGIFKRREIYDPAGALVRAQQDEGLSGYVDVK